MQYRKKNIFLIVYPVSRYLAVYYLHELELCSIVCALSISSSFKSAMI
jgi:hypothetical protein